MYDVNQTDPLQGWTINPEKMDDDNKKAYKILENKGEDAFLKHVSTPSETNDKELTYAEMRARFG